MVTTEEVVPTESLRRQRRRQVRLTIERAALDLFSERSYDDVTVAEIANAAGISLRTFFRYFPSKDAVLLASGATLIDRLLLHLEEQPKGVSAFDAMSKALLASVVVPEEERLTVLKRWQVLHDVPLQRTEASASAEEMDAEERIIAELTRRMGPTADRRQAEVMMVAMHAIGRRAYAMWWTSGGQGDPTDWAATYVDVLGTTFG